MSKHHQPVFLAWRSRLVLFIFVLLSLSLVARMTFLAIGQRNFLLNQGNARSIRTVNSPAYRGMLIDRNGEPLAVSTPIDTIWMNPQNFDHSAQSLLELSRVLQMSPSKLNAMIQKNSHRQFIYLKRSVMPDVAKAIKNLNLSGVYSERSYKRYYPTGEIAAHVIGTTNIDDVGISGLELTFDSVLRGHPGRQRVLKDLYGHNVEILSEIQSAIPGENIQLSLDNRIQFLAYRILKETLRKFNAHSGSVVVLNSQTGEILAMVNQPSYNPNNPPKKDNGQLRNRAVTDTFEPGSTIKIFSIISALESQKYTPRTLINTNPGWYRVKQNIIRDAEGINHGILSVSQVLQKSSNIGIAKMVLSLPPESFLSLLQAVGFGQKTSSGFPGEVSGFINSEALIRPFILATMAFGYAISVTPLQLASAYSIIANEGKKCPLTLLKRTALPACESIVSPTVAQQALKMLETVLQSGGTGILGNVSGYLVAGKTGTAYLVGPHGYDRSRYTSSFVGIAPISHPQLVVAVIIQEPQGKYYGGEVAAPAFSQIMSGTLRILNIAPDSKL